MCLYIYIFYLTEPWRANRLEAAPLFAGHRPHT